MKALLFFVVLAVCPAQIPRTWDDKAVAQLELPLANPKYSPVHLSSEAYYQIPPRTIYKSYPVYRPGREPAGYRDWLKQQEPAVVPFDPTRLRTKQDWIEAGEIVFNAPTSLNPVFFSAGDVQDPSFFGPGGMPVAKDGTIPFARWVVRRKGEVVLGSMGCNTCHTRVLPDGTVVPGAQGNNPGDRQGAAMLRKFAGADPSAALTRMRGFARQFEMPWLSPDPNGRARTMSLDELIATGEAVPPGVTVRANTSMLVPPQIPDLIGVSERRYLDHTGLIQQRSLADLMRYSSLAQDVFGFDRYGDLPPARTGQGTRYTDEQLYALALYLYSLQPPANPHRLNEPASRGKQIFERQGCVRCHTPPLYTNNKLVPADGFAVPEEHNRRFDVMESAIGVDPRYALESHKGTGYYKVPSLKGLWYRGPLEHNGSVATLEDWFDPARVRADYVPTGFKGVGVKTRAVPGHPFGLNLPAAEKAALIAFLRTL